MSSWKRVLTTDDVSNTNIGSGDLTITSGDARRLSFGSASSNFAVRNNATRLILKLEESAVSLGSTVSTATTTINSANGTLTIGGAVSSFTTPIVNITSTNTGSGSQPLLKLRRISSSPADGDALAKILFNGESFNDNEKTYASISGYIADEEANLESGDLGFNVINNGSDYEFFRAKGDGLVLKAEIEEHTFRLTSDETNGSTASPVIDLFSDSGSSSVGDHIGEIRFRADNGNSDPKTFADITAKIADPVNNTEDGEINFNVIKGGSSTEVMSITSDGGDSSSSAATANEQKLKGVQLHGTDLETLTRRNIITFQVGENATISNIAGAANTEHALWMANGVQSVLGTSFATGLGIVAPFNGYIIGGTFQFRHESGTQGDVKMYVRRVHGGGSVDIEVAELEDAQDDDTFYKSNAYAITSSNYRNSGKLVVAGDVLIPYIDLDSNAGTYSISDVVGQFFMYAEALALA